MLEQDFAVMSERLDGDRESLLDLSTRNPMLNYRTLKARGVEVSNQDPQQVYDALVVEGRSMSFFPSPSLENEPSQNAPFEEYEDPTVPLTPKSQDRSAARLETLHTQSDLERRLLNTYYLHRSFIEEQGVNTLYLALGMLTWREDDNSDRDLHAPLVLVPVELRRSTVRESFSIRYSGDEIGSNESIRVKMLESFRIELPLRRGDSNGSNQDLCDQSVRPIQSYFDEIERSIGSRPFFSVDRTRIVLGFFAFAKYLMYVDLDDSKRPADHKLCEHELIGDLLVGGFANSASLPWEGGNLDDCVDPRTTFHVVDADSSQTEAILHAASCSSLVIQGPPGTGKSQTITNIIADAVARNKTVLFVSEKLAALEVVKNRIDQCGLGQLCLELHSNKANKREVLSELSNTLNMRPPQCSFGEDQASRMDRLRHDLNDYCSALHSPIGDSGITPYVAYGTMERCRSDTHDCQPQLLVPDHVCTWSTTNMSTARDAVQRLVDALTDTGTPTEHPFCQSDLTSVTLGQMNEIRLAIDTADARNEDARSSVETCAIFMGVKCPDTVEQVDHVLALADRCSRLPRLGALRIASPDWVGKRTTVVQFIGAAERIAACVSALRSLPSDAWNQDVNALRDALSDFSSKWYRFLSSRYSRAVRAYAELVGGSNTELAKQRLSDKVISLGRIIEVQTQIESISRIVDNEDWTTGIECPIGMAEWPQLTEALKAALALHDDIQVGRVPGALVKFLESNPNIEELSHLAQSCSSAMKARKQAFATLSQALQLSSERGTSLHAAMPFGVAKDLVTVWRTHLSRLPEITNLNAQATRVRAMGLHELAVAASVWKDSPSRIREAFEYGLAFRLVDSAFRDRPSLMEFGRANQDRTVADFAQLDSELIRLNRQRVALSHWEDLPREGNSGVMADLRHEMQKKRRHLPIRKLMSKCGPAIQRMKPVFMMSPLSVATYLDPSAVQFDLVVFDEASQLRPVEAFGAISRANRAIVVGDSKQLPPTSFFDTALIGEDEDDDIVSSTDIESILGMFESKGASSRMLSWHYRSKHESLIAVSNAEFYNNRLVTFPSPDQSRQEYGLKYQYVDGTYDRGGRKINKEEASAVARAVMEHAYKSPHLTLGVATFSISQMEAIRDMIERLRRENPSSDEFFASHPSEPFFVKNLENVQGDERDVIFISVGYGRDCNGNVSMNFGPLNQDGGERRLNVLITRARARCVVFTNLGADDIDLRKTKRRGVAAFKTFLRYAQTGEGIEHYGDYGEPESPFEEAVAERLKSHGYDVEHQVGCAGFCIDLGVVDPHYPGRFVLGIECDGASYHSAAWARDRDRLRQQVLESKGWIIHRIWSTDWFRNPEQAMARTVEAIENARKLGPASMNTPRSQETACGSSNAENSPPECSLPQPNRFDELSDLDSVMVDSASTPSLVQPYIAARFTINTQGKALHEVPRSQMAEWISHVVEIEGPVHFEEVRSRIAENAGMKRAGKRIDNAVRSGIKLASKMGQVAVNGDFLGVPGSSERILADCTRNRSGLPSSSRRIDYVPPQEIRLAVITLADGSCGISLGEAVTHTCRLLGFARTTEAMKAYVEPIIRVMVDEGILEERNGMLQATQNPKGRTECRQCHRA